MNRILMMALIAVTVSVSVVSAYLVFPDPDESPGFEIDEDDLKVLSEEGTDRMYMMQYQRSAEMFLRKAVFDDDVDGDGLSTVESYLRYLKAIDDGKQDFPSFVLGHIQSEFAYVYDRELYGMVDWAAYPIETISAKGGDCEDLAILAVSLLYREGYDCGILVFKDHALAVVSMDRSGCEVSDEYSPFVYEHDGKEYYALETSGTCGIGCTYSDYRPTMAIGAAFTGIRTT